MVRRNHLDAFTRRRMIGSLEEGRSSTSVVEEFGINKSAVFHSQKAFQIIGRGVRMVSGGSPRKIIVVDDQYIILQVKKARNQSASAIAQRIFTAIGPRVAVYCDEYCC
ncbi:transposable element Tcb2 transposase [Trichonephila clavipes]|nr:transposable element Tcb2 transposase [Trichonephila clavipes]